VKNAPDELIEERIPLRIPVTHHIRDQRSSRFGSARGGASARGSLPNKACSVANWTARVGPAARRGSVRRLGSRRGRPPCAAVRTGDPSSQVHGLHCGHQTRTSSAALRSAARAVTGGRRDR
jgi:hypothetical protein